MGALVAIAAGLLGGAWAAVAGLRAPAMWVGALAVLGLALLVTVSVRNAGVRPGKRAWAPFALSGAVVGQGLVPPPSAPVELPPDVMRIEGTVLASRHGIEPSAVVEIERGMVLASRDPLPRARMLVHGLDVASGARVRMVARGRPSPRFFNPTPHPDWPAAAAADARARLVGSPRIVREAPFWERAAHALRRALRARIDETLEPGAAGLCRALVLGETGAIDIENREDVRDAGLSHVLAVSGLHVTLLAGALVWLVARLLVRIERVAARVDVSRIAKGIGVPLALAYALLVGDAPSAWRAALTAAVAWTLAAAGRRAHPVTVTAAAALLVAALRPDDLPRPGFLLSIVATAALVSGPRVPESWARAALVVSARTTVATAPFVLWMFGQVPLVGLIANLVVVPIAGALLLPACALHAALALVLPPLAPITAPIVELSSSAFFAASEVFALVPWGRDLPPPDVLQGVTLAALALALLVLRRWRWRAAALAIAAVIVAGGELWLRHREQPTGVLRATFLDVGQGDAAIVDLPDGRVMVVDAGGAAPGGPDPGERVLVPLLRARRRARIDVLAISHPHPDHYGGAGALIDAFEIGEVWDTGQGEAEQPDGELARLLARARARGAIVRRPEELCGRELAFGAARARVRWPCPSFDPGFGPNDNSLVIELEHAGRRVWLTGDVEAHAESALAAARPAPVDVLKVAHHGSRTSSAASLLDALSPSIAVASMGRHNRFGHPHAEVWARLRARVACPLRTDRHGGLIVTIDARGGLRAHTTLGERRCEAPPLRAKRAPASR
ncbi:MAG TPA: DNA internalization-related competence protein ComEC/Rec2 [Sandaracinaceae bacterium]